MKRRFLTVFLLLCCLYFQIPTTYAVQTCSFPGLGTQKDPYLISSFDDLCELSNLVNSGTSFEGKYFMQTQNIDMRNVSFTPIGLYDGSSFFRGTYNGNGYRLENVNISYGGNNGLFGKLGGTVMNLGIENGRISGECVGAIASHSSSSTAIIINCYNKATVIGARAGGIADNFNGVILNCWTDCDLQASEPSFIGAIYSYDATYSKNCIFSYNYEDSGAENQFASTFLPCNENTKEKLINKLNSTIYDSANIAGMKASSINKWHLDELGNLALSQNTYSYNLRDFPVYIKANMIYIIPILIAIAGVILLSAAFLQKSTKFISK